jgi:BirA family biotin operon repressor/biotin-[acetyl-CoA-carboxylase] ligase
VHLGQGAANGGYRIESYETVGSTNDLAMARARNGDAGRLWILSAAQSGGRGRLGRVWSSPPGNLFASLMLIDPAPAARAAQLGFVTGVALSRALETLGVGGGRLTLKWPNDALLDGAKISGVLLEATTVDARLACVIGIGVNCVAHPDGLPYPATDLGASGFAITREALFEALSDAMARELVAWDGGAGFSAARAAWLERAAGLGSRIKVVAGARRHSGVFTTIDVDGRLILKTDAGEVAVDAGDVLLPALTPSRFDDGQGNN